MVGQKKAVLDYMEEHGGITSMEAFELGITRLSAVIFDLRKAGHHIKTNDVTTRNRYGQSTTYSRYTLEPGQARMAL